MSAVTARAAGAITGLSWTLMADGQAPFTSGDVAGEDSAAHNNRVRAQDTVYWGVNYTATADATVLFVLTLPAGMEWTAESTSPTVCNGPSGGTLSGDKTVLTCERVVTDGEVSHLPVSARVGGIGNGTTLYATATADGITAVSAENLTVSAAPRTQFSLWHSYEQNATVGGVTGVRSYMAMAIGAAIDPANPDFYGYEALGNTFTFSMTVPEGAIPVAQSSNSGGSVTAEQAGGPGTPITYTVTGVRSNFLNPTRNINATGMGGGDDNAARMIAQLNLSILTPYSADLQPGEPGSVSYQVTGFDPESVSGQSNFGTATAPGQAAGATCPATPNYWGLYCVGADFIRPEGAEPGAARGNVISMAASDGRVYGDARAIIEGTEAVVVGQQYEAVTSMYNGPSALESLRNPYASLTWNPDEQQLRGAPRVVIRNWANMWSMSNKNDVMGSAVVPASDYTLEYTDFAFTGLGDRMGRESFTATDMTWVTDPATLPGGWASVSSLRIVYHGELAANQTLGLATPLVRAESSASVAAGTTMLWNWQYGADNAALVTSAYNGFGGSDETGGMVQATGPLVRGSLSWLPVEDAAYPAGQAERGDIARLSLTPVLVGPVTGADAVSRDTRYTITMPNACLEPVAAALPANAHLTPGVPGTDCMSGTPAVIVIDLGDVTVPAGAAGPLPYQGHAVELAPVVIPVTVAVGHSTPAVAEVAVVASATTDKTVADNSVYLSNIPASLNEDRTLSAGLTVSGAVTFKLSKSAITETSGLAGPGETVPYVISWANASALTYTPVSVVDVLPFEGDRRGTHGLGGTLTVTDIQASMATTAQGAVTVEYTTDNASSVEAAVHQPGNETGATGVAWHNLTGAVPAGVTAVRFTSTNPVEPEFTGTATIQVRMPALERGAQVTNNLSVRAISGTSDLIAADSAKRPLGSSSAELTGTVSRDLDFDGVASAADGTWPATASAVELSRGGSVVATADIRADGSYSVGPIAAGTYSVALTGGAADGWTKLSASGDLTVAVGATETADLLYQEVVPAAELQPDLVAATAGVPVTIPVTGNDRIHLPQAPGSIVSNPNTIAIASPPTRGQAEVGAPISPSLFSAVTYTPEAAWPAEAAGQASYLDTFRYSYTNVNGIVSSTEVTVRVYPAPEAQADDLGIVADRPLTADVLANDTGDTLAYGAHPTVVSGDATVRYAGTGLEITPTHVWSGSEITHNIDATYTVVDARGATSTAHVTVTVQRAPVALAATTLAAMADNATATIDPQLLNPAVVAIPAGIVTSHATSGTASVTGAGQIEYTPSASGAQSVRVTYTDNLGQATAVTYTVPVQAAPRATVDSARMTIGVGRTAAFATPTVATTGSIASVSSDTTRADAGGTVTVDPTTGRATFVHNPAAPAGDYPFSVSYTDNLGQTSTIDYTVTVQAAAVVDIETSRTIGMGQDAVFIPVSIVTDGHITAVTPGPVSATRGGQSPTVTTDVATGTVTFHANEAPAGEYTFDVTYTDNLGNETVASFIVTVQAPPVQSDDVVEQTIPLGGEAHFADAVTTTGTIVDRRLTAPGTGTADLTAVGPHYAAGDAPAGVYTFEVVYTDNVQQSVTVTYAVTVQDAPRGEDVWVTVPFGTERVLVDPLGDVTGTNLQELTAGSFTQPARGQVALNGNGLLVFTPENEFTGTAVFAATGVDDLAQSATVTYHVTVEPQPVGDAPHPPRLALTGAETGLAGALAALALVGGVVLLLTRVRRSRS